METHRWAGGCHLVLQARERLGSNSILSRIRLLVPVQAGKGASVSQSNWALLPKLSALLPLVPALCGFFHEPNTQVPLPCVFADPTCHMDLFCVP